MNLLEVSKQKLIDGILLLHITVADPEFPGGGGANRKNRALTYYFGQYFLKKKHENEKQLNRKGARIPGAPSDPPMQKAAVVGVVLRRLWNKPFKKIQHL